MRPQEIFLSHSSKDRLFASKVAKQFRQHGIPVWYSETNIVGAQQWHDEIGEALKRCHWFVLILSPHSIKSTWVKNELMFALNNHRYKKRIVPLLYKSCRFERLSWTLPSFEIVDFSQSVDDGFRELLRVWGIVYKKRRPVAKKASRKRNRQ